MTDKKNSGTFYSLCVFVCLLIFLPSATCADDNQAEFNSILDRLSRPTATIGAPQAAGNPSLATSPSRVANTPSSHNTPAPSRVECVKVSFEASIVSKRSPFSFQLGIGDEVLIKTPEKKSLKAVFLGQSKENILFYLKDSEEIVANSVGDVRFIDGTGKSIDPQGAGGIQRLLEIERQSGPTCSVHSTLNCLKFLNEIKAIVDKSFQKDIVEEPEALFKELYDVVSSAAARRGGYSQSEARKSMLAEEGIEIEITKSVRKLIAHLQAGRPAILDLDDIAYDSVKIKNLGTGAVKKIQGTRPVASGDKARVGAHSVLALGYFSTGIFSGKFLILDSANGTINIWDKSALSKALSVWNDSDVSLVK